jgi:hypothetical protein
MSYLPHTLLQVAMCSAGTLYVATQSTDGLIFERLPLIDGVAPTKYPPVDANEWKVPRPDWAIDCYVVPAWELASLQYDSIGN